MNSIRDIQPVEIAAVLVTYYPDTDFPTRLTRIMEQVGHVVVVDNGSAPEQQTMLCSLREASSVTVLINERNLGIATALNQGIYLVKDKGYQWAVTLDQDSTAAPDMIKNLINTLQGCNEPEKVALIGSNRIDEDMTSTPQKWLRPKRGIPFFEKVICEKIGPDGVTIVITSGTLTNLKVIDEIGQFEDAFFIDFVDTEYCLRAQKAGYRILVSCQAKFDHRLGAKREVSFLGLTLTPTFHEPIRRYYISRNRIVVIRKYGLSFWHWLIYDLADSIYGLLCLLLCEDKKIEKLTSYAQGTWDGLCGRLGKK